MASRGGNLVRILGVIHLGHDAAQLLGGLEHGYRARRHLDGRARTRVACHPRLTLTDLERPEAANLDVLLLLQRKLDGIEKRIHDAGAVLLGDHRAGSLRYLRRHTLDKVGFGHSVTSDETLARWRSVTRT